ncbi:hypothetical protein GE09DRAFT_1107068 [Coniochaeta sp. 2T2.1]|nr:hypothetical protein GE09DRAFT_1107068 [Coniochaeta sp. 2T2.1]
MPPAISDEETSDVEVPRGTPRSARAKVGVKYKGPEPLEIDEDDEALETEEPTNGKADDDEEEDDEEGEDGAEPDEYVVEKILSHRWEKSEKQLRFEVKWEGYEDKKDRTWEPEENLLETSVLEEYYAAHGGKEKMIAEAKEGIKSKKRGRQQSDTPSTTNKRSRKNGDAHPLDTTPPATKRAAWKPPSGLWEDHIADLDVIEDDESGKLMVYVTWKDGRKTQHETSVIHKRAPQKMLQFYERHVRIIKRDANDVADEAVL